MKIAVAFLPFISLVAAERTESNVSRRLYSPGYVSPPPPKEMYKELIYIEKDCRDYNEIEVNDNVEEVEIGDMRNFKCDLFEFAINFGQYGGDLVGETVWTCKVVAFEDGVDFDTADEDDIKYWDCTFTDYIGAPEGDETTLRNEGITPKITSPEEENREDDDDWEEYHSHTGLFSTVGGTILGKGARGEVEVVWDHYKMTWLHLYTVEVWALEQPPLPLYGSHHTMHY